MITGKTIALTAAAKSLQSCPTLCDPIDGSPPGSPAPGILQARTLEWVAISFSNVWKWKVKVKSLSHVRLLATPWTTAYQAPPSVGFSRQEHWSGLPLPSPIALTRWTVFGKVMALLFNMLSRIVIAFLPRSERLLISWLQTPSAVILKPRKIKSVTVSIVSPSTCDEVMGPDAMIFAFECCFKPTFSLSPFIFIQRLFSSSSLSAIRVVSSVYLGLLILLPQSWYSLGKKSILSFISLNHSVSGRLSGRDGRLGPTLRHPLLWHRS